MIEFQLVIDKIIIVYKTLFKSQNLLSEILRSFILYMLKTSID
jgi:hypothetical protein